MNEPDINNAASAMSQQLTSTSRGDEQGATASKYGPTRLARYLLRSFEDWFDVCETINRQILERVEREDVEPVHREIPCWAMSVPNTVSSVIVGLGIPSTILEDSHTSTRPVRPLQLDYSKIAQPAVKKTDKMIVMAQDVKTLFELNAFGHYLRNSDEMKSHGLDIAAIRRSIKMTVKKRDGVKANFALILTYNFDLGEQIPATQVSAKPIS